MHECGHVLLFNQLALLIKVLSCYPAQMIFLLAAAFLRSAVSRACFLLVTPFTVFLFYFFLTEIPLTHIVDLSFEVNNIDSKLRRAEALLLVPFLSWCRCVAEFPGRGHYHLIWVRTRLHHAAKSFNHRKMSGIWAIAAEFHPGGWMQRQTRYFSPASHMTTCDATALMFSLQGSLANSNILLIPSRVLTATTISFTHKHTHLSGWGLKMTAANFASASFGLLSS